MADPAPFTGEHDLHDKEKEYILKPLAQAQNDVHEALCDSFSTPRALMCLREVMNSVNTYRSSVSPAKRNLGLVGKVVEWVEEILKCFGVVIAGGPNAAVDLAGGAVQSKEDIAMPFVKVVSDFRNGVRQLAQSGAGMHAFSNTTLDSVLYRQI